jgi:hypothetical protein
LLPENCRTKFSRNARSTATTDWDHSFNPSDNTYREQFYQALALSEYDTLVQWQRPVIRLHLTRDFPAALDQSTYEFGKALHRFYP